ncbi:hypothetical protein GCM10011389_12550 [Pontibacillus salipaludis]|uniref:Uncharacterized protein n=1 Tax=Pontibacillus salipaludis TaxID=1697394 RepID=A0ABQ1PY08_9BACI|nr:hypothetical protein GCM10011389_12550 [Pontibacillus salipaludis]
MNGPLTVGALSPHPIYGSFESLYIWQRWVWKLRDSRGQKSLGETPETGFAG